MITINSQDARKSDPSVTAVEDGVGEKTLPPEQSGEREVLPEVKIWTHKELEEIRKNVFAECWKTRDKKCILGAVEMYDHDGGNFVEGEKEKQWLYFTCSRCGYQWALWKLLKRLEDQKEVNHA